MYLAADHQVFQVKKELTNISEKLLGQIKRIKSLPKKTIKFTYIKI